MNEDLESCPPKLYLRQVAEHCPLALWTYMLLWDNKDYNNRLHIYKKDIKHEYLMDIRKFQTDLMKLVKEGLISVHETEKVIHIDIVSWDEE